MPAWVRDPKTLPKAALAEIVAELQVLLFADEEAGGLVWDFDKEVDGADLVDWTTMLLKRYDLVPLHGPREWSPKSRRR